MQKNIQSTLLVDYGYVGLLVTCKISKNGAAPVNMSGNVVDNEDNTYTITFAPEDRNADELTYIVSAVGLQDKTFYENTTDSSAIAAIANTVIAALSGKSVILNSPTTETGDVEIFTASDYNSMDVLALTWSLTSSTDLTNADVRFKCESISKAAVVTNPNGATKTIAVELTNVETALLSPGNYDYYIEAVINGRILPPLITGKLIVKSK